MCQNINIGNFEYSQDEKGNWIYKAIETKRLPNKKAKYQDKPQYKAIEVFEDRFKKDYVSALNQSIKDIDKYLNQ